MNKPESEMVLVPREPTEAMLRPFYECPPAELPLAWQAAMHIAERAAPQGAQPAEPVAWLCEWAEWSQYHDANDPLPETWDSAPPLKITPLYASPADAAPVPQEVRMLTGDEIRQEKSAWLASCDIFDEFLGGARFGVRKFCEVNAGLTIPATKEAS